MYRNELVIRERGL